MNLNDIQSRLIGRWEGTNLLRLSWLTPSDYVSKGGLSVATVARGKFLAFTYTWNHEDVEQEGLILAGYDHAQSIATAAWVDSWHQSSKVLTCEGTIDDQGVINVRGFYPAPPGPDWGWRITIRSTSEKDLQIVMHNITPDGVEDLAVQADYARAA